MLNNGNEQSSVPLRKVALKRAASQAHQAVNQRTQPVHAVTSGPSVAALFDHRQPQATKEDQPKEQLKTISFGQTQ